MGCLILNIYMALELILSKVNEIFEDRYQSHKALPNVIGPLSKKQTAYSLLEFGYSLMKEAWKYSATESIIGRVASETLINHIDTDSPIDILSALTPSSLRGFILFIRDLSNI